MTTDLDLGAIQYAGGLTAVDDAISRSLAPHASGGEIPVATVAIVVAGA